MQDAIAKTIAATRHETVIEHANPHKQYTGKDKAKTSTPAIKGMIEIDNNITTKIAAIKIIFFIFKIV